MKGKMWLCTVCHYLELHLREFANDQITISWILSFFREGRAGFFTQEAYDFKEKHEDQWRWTLLDKFLTKFKKEFYEEEAETVAFLKLKGTEYFQGKRTTLDYCDLF
jgi:hypothetical protein